MKTGIAESMLLRRDDSELVLEVGPLAIFRGSSLAYKDGRRDVEPAIRPYYTVAINPYWLDEGVRWSSALGLAAELIHENRLIVGDRVY